MNRLSLVIFDILKNRRVLSFLHEYNKCLNSSKPDIEKNQFEKLKKLLTHAEKNVPFYKERFKESGFSPDDFFRMDQLKTIPPLTRYDLQNHWRELIASNYNRNDLSKGSSSGSTGIPVIYYKDRIASSAGQAANLIGWSLSGWKMQKKGLHIWGNPSTVNNEWKRLSSKLKARIFFHHKFPAYKLTDGSKFQELYQLINRNKYDYIDGYTNAIYLYADYLKANKLKHNTPLDYVFTTAENLQEYQRRTIEEVIGPVYDSYGCSEINGICYECQECKNYHVIDPHVYVEFGEEVDTYGSHRLLITDLDNYAFPLIRYQNDDLGVPLLEKQQNCSIKFSPIKSISGRESDIIKLRDGGTFSVPSFFGSMLLKQIAGLKQYQVERVSEDLLYINLVKSETYSTQDHAIIEKGLFEYLGNKIKYEIRFVEAILPLENGKFKLLIDKTNKQ